MSRCQGHTDKCILRAWQDKYFVEEVSRIGRGIEMAPWSLLDMSTPMIYLWYLKSLPVPPWWLWLGEKKVVGTSHPCSGVEYQGLISYWEMLLWVLNVICFYSSFSPVLQIPAAPKGGCAGWTEYPLSGWTILSQWERIHWTSLLMQMSPLFRKLGLLTKDHYHGETQWEEVVKHALFPLLCL